LKWKYEDCKTNLMERINSPRGRLVCISMWDHFSIISNTMSVGTLVNKETTSKEAKQQSSGMCRLESFFNNCELFFM